MNESLSSCLRRILADRKPHTMRSLVYETWALIPPETAARDAVFARQRGGDVQIIGRTRYIRETLWHLRKIRGCYPERPRLVIEKTGIGLDATYRLVATVACGSNKCSKFGNGSKRSKH